LHINNAFLYVLQSLLSKQKQQDNKDNKDKDNEDTLHCLSKKRMVTKISMDNLQAATVSADSSSMRTSSDIAKGCFRSYQAKQWSHRYGDLVAFCGIHGHCLVPHNMPENPPLATCAMGQTSMVSIQAIDRWQAFHLDSGTSHGIGKLGLCVGISCRRMGRTIG
jgi:hypothetical protein